MEKYTLYKYSTDNCILCATESFDSTMEEIANMNINGKHLSIGRKWVCTELPRERSFLFGRLLEDHCFNFETSEVGKLIHFQVLASETEIEFLNKFIDNNY